MSKLGSSEKRTIYPNIGNKPMRWNLMLKFNLK